MEISFLGYETIGDHTEFALQVTYGGAVWPISRRFNDFSDLHARMKLKKIAELPPKQWFGRFKTDFLAKRQQQLQKYVDALLKIPRVTSNGAFLEFMEVDQHVDTSHMSMMPSTQNGIVNNQQEEDVLAMEQARQQAIVSDVARQFINISESEQLASHQARQRQADILQACQGFSQQADQLKSLSKTCLPKTFITDSTAIDVLNEPSSAPDMQDQLAHYLAATRKRIEESTAIASSDQTLIGRLVCMA